MQKVMILITVEVKNSFKISIKQSKKHQDQTLEGIEQKHSNTLRKNKEK